MSASVSHLKPVTLLPVRARQVADGDPAPGIPNTIRPGLYESVHDAGASAHTGPIPPLAYFCIRTLLNYADQLHGLGSLRIRCQPEVLRALSPPTFRYPGVAARCLCKLDPRLWSIIVQVYSELPEGLQIYRAPLGDRHLPLLQAIPSTPSFALITVLNLAGRISDETSHALKSLHGLCALDISQTSISHLGIRHFAPTVTSEPSDPRHGTRGLRILRLCNCPKITDQVIGAVSSFSLLAILDLRGTSCARDLNSDTFRRSSKSQRDLFQCSLLDALWQLKNSDSRSVLFSHPHPFVIDISTEFHPHWPQRPDHPKPAPGTSAFLPENSRVTASSSGVSVSERFRSYQDPHAMEITEAERKLRDRVHFMLGSASNETRISEITAFVMQRWKYKPEWLESDGERDSLSGCPSEDDSIDSWDEDDEDSSTTSCLHFCEYEVSESLVERVWDMVEDAREEHESAIRFYGLDSRAPKAVVCHCKQLQRTTVSPAESMPTDRYLMLVRDPPPWESVYGPDAPPPRRIRLATKPSLSDSSNLNPNRSSMQTKKSTREIMDMITQRKSLPTSVVSPSLDSAPTVSRNPFRKDPTSGSVRGGLGDPHRRHGNSAQGGNSGSVPDAPTPKRMKSISQIPVPPRPTSSSATLQSQRTKSGGGPGIMPKKSGKLKQTTLLGAFGKQT